MKKSKYFKPLSTNLAIYFMMALTACGQSESQTQSSTSPEKTSSTQNGSASASQENKEDKKLTTLTGFISYGANQTGIDKSIWFNDYLKENLGIKLEFKDTGGADTNQLTQALLASGELPDIMGFSSKDLANNAATAGMLINLNDYKEQLPSVFQNEHFKNMIEFSQDSYAPEKKGLYVLMSSVGNNNFINYTPQLRWETYKEVGSPVIKNTKDMLDTLKKMQDAYPKTEEGKNVYGFTLFNEWDKLHMSNICYMYTSLFGYDNETVSPLVEVKADGTEEPRSILDDQSLYKKGLQFYFDANKMGLVDPDSISQKWDSVSAKYKNGQVLFSPWKWWDSSPASGFEPVWQEDYKVLEVPDNPIGRSWTLSISSKTKNIEKALEFINFYLSYDCVDMMLNGPKGELWDVNEKGERFYTEKGIQSIKGEQVQIGSGGTVGDAASIINIQFISNHSINPATGKEMAMSTWDMTSQYNTNELFLDWQKANDGVASMYVKAKKTNKLAKINSALNMMPIKPDDIVAIETQVGDIIKTNSWKMVFAKDQGEFDTLWKQMQDDCNTLGMDQILKWTRDEFKKALETANKYK